MLSPTFLFDSEERWFPIAVEESLSKFGYEWHGGAGTWLDKNKQPVSHLNFPAKMTQPDLKPVGYRRVIHRVNLYWHQYWLWYLYNPKNFVGSGQHEGDWEFVQLGCTDPEGSQPVLVTGSQHHTGVKREFWRTEQANGSFNVYVALGSHANYLSSMKDLEDRADGKGKALHQIEWRAFGPWAMWAGRWGNSRGVGKSPESPGLQSTRWNTPHIFHGQSR